VDGILRAVTAVRDDSSTPGPDEAKPVPPRLRRQYVKLCDLSDFDDPDVRQRIRSIVPGNDEQAELRRKFWEYAMLTLFLEDVGKLAEPTEALSVGAGHEEVLFWLTNRIGRVVATDIYGEGTFVEANDAMLTDPASYAPYPYREERLDVRHMDGRQLDFEDASFDVVFSLSSIEHFGSTRDVQQAAREIGRVVRPGGFAFIVTECFLSRHITNSRVLQTAVRLATRGRACEKATLRRRALDVFTPRELESLIVRPSGLELVQPLDRTLTPDTWDNVIVWSGPGQYEPATGEPWPHIILRPAVPAFSRRIEGAAFTSVALALSKPNGRS
jgi:SAM-dependent methyltransferase